MKQARGKKRTIGPREQAFLDANPEAPAVFKTKRAFDEAGAVINQAAQQAKSKGDGEKAAAIRDVRKGLVNEFLLRQKEGRLNGAAQDFDRFVRDRISGL